MNNVYEVKYEALTQSEHKGNHRKAGKPGWSNGEVHVVANGTVIGALMKAEKFLLARVERYDDEYGAPMVERTLQVKLTSCERLLTLDA
jgi:hypothetical protein